MHIIFEDKFAVEKKKLIALGKFTRRNETVARYYDTVLL